MRKLSRIRDNKIPAAFRGTKRIAQTLKLLETEREIKKGTIEKHEFDSTWSPCKSQLHRESSSKCAYCESPTTVVSYGDVEHYRPKSKYWWLAYCYDNYLASCTLCNQKYKKAKFKILNSKIKRPSVRKNSTNNFLNKIKAKTIPDPLIELEGFNWNDYESIHLSERPLLLNPYIDNPEDFFAWEVDGVSESVKIIPLNAQDSFNVKVVKASEDDYGINREELCFHRFEVYLLYCFARVISEDTAVPAQFRNMQKKIKSRLLRDESAYTGMLAFFEKMKTNELIIP